MHLSLLENHRYVATRGAVRLSPLEHRRYTALQAAATVVRAGIRAEIRLSPLENHDYNDTQKTALPRVKYGVCMVKSRAPHGEMHAETRISGGCGARNRTRRSARFTPRLRARSLHRTLRLAPPYLWDLRNWDLCPAFPHLARPAFNGPGCAPSEGRPSELGLCCFRDPAPESADEVTRPGPTSQLARRRRTIRGR